MSFDAMRQRAATYIAIGCWPLVLGSGLAAWIAGNPIPPIVAVAVACALVAGAGSRHPTPNGRLAVAVGFVAQASALTAALAGHSWQPDSHMVFFALLAVTMGMADIRAVTVAAFGIALHHLGLTFVMPALVYPSADLADNLLRTGFHGAVVMLEAVPLCLAIRSRARLDGVNGRKSASLEEAIGRSDRATEEASRARLAAEAALRRSESDRAAAEAAYRQAGAEGQRAQAADAAARAARDAHQARLLAASEERALVMAVLSEGLGHLADRDLRHDIATVLPEAHDGLRVNFNVALHALREALDQAATDARLMAHEGAALRELALDLSDRTEAQGATVEGTAATIGDVAERARMIAEGATRADRMVHDVHAAARQAGAIVDETAGSMAALRDGAVRIEEIVRTIEDISFQTNLLSLNAGIEAARAGQAGRGFAVVAAEVGALARRSQDAASRINELAGQSRKRVDTSVALVSGSVEALGNITDLVQQMLATVSRIAGAAAEQSEQLAAIDGALDELGGIARSNARAARNSVTAAAEIGERALRLDRTMASFRRPGNGSGADREARSAA